MTGERGELLTPHKFHHLGVVSAERHCGYRICEGATVGFFTDLGMSYVISKDGPSRSLLVWTSNGRSPFVVRLDELRVIASTRFDALTL